MVGCYVVLKTFYQKPEVNSQMWTIFFLLHARFLVLLAGSQPSLGAPVGNIINSLVK